MTVKTYQLHVCDFCGKDEREVEKMVVHPKATVAICDGCTDLAADIVREHRAIKKSGTAEWALPSGLAYDSRVAFTTEVNGDLQYAQAGSVNWTIVKTWELA